MSLQEAKDECKTRASTLATPAQLKEAFNQGMEQCACGYLTDGSVQYPMQKPRPGCTLEPKPVIVACPAKNPGWGGTKGFDAYCYGESHSSKRIIFVYALYTLILDMFSPLKTQTENAS